MNIWWWTPNHKKKAKWQNDQWQKKYDHYKQYKCEKYPSWCNHTPKPIPEPASGLLFITGALIVGLAVRKKNK